MLYLQLLLILLSLIFLLIFLPMFLVSFLPLQLMGHIFHCHLFLIFRMFLLLFLIFVPSLLLLLLTFLLIPVVPLLPLFVLSFLLSFGFSPPFYSRLSAFPLSPLPCPFLILLHLQLTQFMLFFILLVTNYHHRSYAGVYTGDNTNRIMTGTPAVCSIKHRDTNVQCIWSVYSASFSEALYFFSLILSHITYVMHHIVWNDRSCSSWRKYCCLIL
jgi:hypothetical protein